MNKSGNIGTWTAETVVRFLHNNGWPHAERTALHGIHDRGDITGTPGICWEVKGGHAAETASDGQVTAWLLDTERERRAAGADVGVLVLKRKGHGRPNAGAWWAVVWVPTLTVHTAPGLSVHPRIDMPARLRLADVCVMLRQHGYGDPLDWDAA